MGGERISLGFVRTGPGKGGGERVQDLEVSDERKELLLAELPARHTGRQGVAFLVQAVHDRLLEGVVTGVHGRFLAVSFPEGAVHD